MDIRDIIEQKIMPQIKQPLWESWYIKEKIGSGSFSVVYRIEAERPSGIDVSALKIEAITADGQIFSDSTRKSTFLNNKKQMAVNEVQIMKKLRDCPYIVRYEEEHMQEIYIDGEFEGYYYLIKMEYLENVYEQMRKKRFAYTESNVRKLAAEIGQGLKAAHDIGIIHRDIKPENMFISESGCYKLGDFSIAKKAVSTRTFAGTQYYMAPEIFWAKANAEISYTTQADIYSFGLCLYQMMNNGQLPFEDQMDPDSAYDKRMKEPLTEPPCNASDAFSEVILKACALNAADRYKTVDEMLADLSRKPEPLPKQTVKSEEDSGTQQPLPEIRQFSQLLYERREEHAIQPAEEKVLTTYADENNEQPAKNSKKAGVLKWVCGGAAIAALIGIGIILIPDKESPQVSVSESAESSPESSIESSEAPKKVKREKKAEPADTTLTYNFIPPDNISGLFRFDFVNTADKSLLQSSDLLNSAYTKGSANGSVRTGFTGTGKQDISVVLMNLVTNETALLGSYTFDFDNHEIQPNEENPEEAFSTVGGLAAADDNATLRSGIYEIINKAELTSIEYTPGQPNQENMILDSSDGSSEQQYYVEYLGSGMYRIRLMHADGGYLNYYCEPPVTVGVNITRWPNYENSTQQFYLENTSSKTYLIESVDDPSVILEAWHDDSGIARIHTARFTADSPAQLWRFEPV